MDFNSHRLLMSNKQDIINAILLLSVIFENEDLETKESLYSLTKLILNKIQNGP